MSKLKIVGIMALIAFVMGVVVVSDAVAAEKGKLTYRMVNYITTAHTLKVPDVEGHINMMFEAKGITFYDKWGPAKNHMISSLDLIKGTGPFQGYNHVTFSDGSTVSVKFEGKSTATGAGLVTGVASAEGTWTYTKGTGKFDGIQGSGTFKTYTVGPGQFYSDGEGKYTLP